MTIQDCPSSDTGIVVYEGGRDILPIELPSPECVGLLDDDNLVVFQYPTC